MGTVPSHARPAGTRASIERRRFLSVGLGAGVAGALGIAVGAPLESGAAPAGASSPANEGLWRLNPSWGFALAGSGRCECNCTACVRHGENKVFFDRAAAENGRAHPGCACIAEPLVSAVSAASLHRLSTDGRSVDRRDPAVAALFDAAHRSAAEISS